MKLMMGENPIFEDDNEDDQPIDESFVKKLVKESDKPSKPKKELSEDLEIFYKDIAEKMKQKLGTKVTINAKEDGFATK